MDRPIGLGRGASGSTGESHDRTDPALIISTYEFLANWLRARFGDERGASLVEYALLIALIAVVCIGAMTLLGRNVSSKMDTLGGSIN